MRSTLTELLDTGRVLLADGATGTNYMTSGLGPGEPPELWNVESPERVVLLHQQFVNAGADIILTNTFGCNRRRLALHSLDGRVHELAAAASGLARKVADAADRSVVVAGSVGPTGDLFAPLGEMTHDVAVAVFREQIDGLMDGGADVIWIETMSATEEVRAAAEAAGAAGAPYVVTCSFDTAGRTMMGLAPAALAEVTSTLDPAPVALGANCGVGAPDLLVAVLSMDPSAHAVVAKGNCGIPQFRGAEIVYSGTPELMANYTHLAIDAGMRIVGGCCGTTPEHLAAMRQALDSHRPGPRPSVDDVINRVGPLTNVAASDSGNQRTRTRRRAGEH